MSESKHKETLHQAIIRYGQPAEMEKFLQHIMRAESGGNVRAKNDNSTATGLFQFIRSTWRAYGRDGDIYDPVAQCDAVVRFTMDNANVLKATLRREPTAGEYYLAHFAGPEGARKVLTASPSTPISALLGAGAMEANAGIKFRGKSFGDWTAADIQEWTAARMGVDLDARRSYAQRHRSGLTTAQEDKEELETRRRNLASFGVESEMMDKLGPLAILGDIFFAIIKFFMDESAPAAERQQGEEARQATTMRTVHKVQATTLIPART